MGRPRSLWFTVIPIQCVGLALRQSSLFRGVNIPYSANALPRYAGMPVHGCYAARSGEMPEVSLPLSLNRWIVCRNADLTAERARKREPDDPQEFCNGLRPGGPIHLTLGNRAQDRTASLPRPQSGQYYIPQHRHRRPPLVRVVVVAGGDRHHQFQSWQQEQPLSAIPNSVDGLFVTYPARTVVHAGRA